MGPPHKVKSSSDTVYLIPSHAVLRGEKYNSQDTSDGPEKNIYKNIDYLKSNTTVTFLITNDTSCNITINVSDLLPHNFIRYGQDVPKILIDNVCYQTLKSSSTIFKYK